MDRSIMGEWIVDALKDLGGLGTILAVNEHIWQHHEAELKASGDFFFKWQYEVRWAAAMLRKNGALVKGKTSRRGVWELA